jgi:murein DD-endopeptidase MepM/ murein hydrolase activator NlpD
MLGTGYTLLFKHFFGSPKETRLTAELDEYRFRYKLLENDFSRVDNALTQIAGAEDNVYRPVLDMEQLSETFRQSGYGGSKKYEELEGYSNSELMIKAARELDELLRKTYVQSKSFEEIIPEAEDWKRKIEHIPYIRPVKVTIPLGEGIRYRDEHPVLGISRWHYGQDFSAPIGTKVYATGAGTVVKSAWTPYGFGNRIEIDHGYGFTSIYGHLSGFNCEVGDIVKRGDMIGFSGSTGVSSGPHLHYEIHYNGKAQNPLYFFEDDLTLDEYFEMISAMDADTLK